MRVVAVVQARFGSSRLPAKILLDLCGKTALERCLTRVRATEGIDEVVVATTEARPDDLIASAASRLGYRAIRGSELDVLSRYAKAARETKADVVIRVTSDCPFFDPTIAARVLTAFHARPSTDYASNTLSRTLPRGLDTEVIAAPALLRADAEATDPGEREHVTMHVYRNRDRFSCVDVPFAPAQGDLSRHRWTLDTPEDYEFLYKLAEKLGERAGVALMDEVLATCLSHPELLGINDKVVQKAH